MGSAPFGLAWEMYTKRAKLIVAPVTDTWMQITVCVCVCMCMCVCVCVCVEVYSASGSDMGSSRTGRRGGATS